MQFKTLRSDKEGAKLFDVLAKSCFSIEIKLSHQLYSLPLFIIPRGEILTPIFSVKFRLNEGITFYGLAHSSILKYKSYKSASDDLLVKPINV